MKKPLWIVLAVLVLVVLLIFLLMAAITGSTTDKTAASNQSTEDLDKEDSENAGTAYEYDEGDEEEEGDGGAEAEDDEASDNPFFGEWLCDPASIYIDVDEGSYSVYIMWDIDDTKESIWEYDCTLDGATGALTGKGRKTNESYDGEGEVVSSEVEYTDGSATFTIEDNALIWADAKEDVAQGMRFERGETEEFLVEVG